LVSVEAMVFLTFSNFEHEMMAPRGWHHRAPFGIL
jgi:hypothetical protein